MDGYFQQIYLADVTNAWNWEQYDQFVLRTINLLIGDEFLDGELADISVSDIVTNYSLLKRGRKLVKRELLSGEPIG